RGRRPEGGAIEVRPLPVSAREIGALDGELAGAPGLDRPSVLVEQMHPQVLDRVPDRQKLSRERRRAVDEILKAEARLGRPEPVDEDALGLEVIPVELRVETRGAVAFESDEPEIREAPATRDEAPEDRRDRVEDRDAFSG